MSMYADLGTLSCVCAIPVMWVAGTRERGGYPLLVLGLLIICFGVGADIVNFISKSGG